MHIRLGLDRMLKVFSPFEITAVQLQSHGFYSCYNSLKQRPSQVAPNGDAFSNCLNQTVDVSRIVILTMDIVDNIAQWGFSLVLTSVTVLGDNDVDDLADAVLFGFTPSIVYVMKQLVKAPGHGVRMTIVTSMTDRLPIFVFKDVFDTTKVSVKDGYLVKKFSGRISSRVMVETKADTSGTPPISVDLQVRTTCYNLPLGSRVVFQCAIRQIGCRGVHAPFI